VEIGQRLWYCFHAVPSVKAGQTDAADLFMGKFACSILGIYKFLLILHKKIVEKAACRSQLSRLLAAVKERVTQFFFQMRYLSAYGWLGHIHLLRSLGETQVSGYRYEIVYL